MIFIILVIFFEACFLSIFIFPYILQIQPELITLDPMDILRVNRPSNKNSGKAGFNDDDDDDDDDDDEVSACYKRT